jgi:Bacterial Ig-like domain (group 3)
MMRSRNWLVAVATFGIVIAGLGWSATPASAAGTSTGSIYTSVNPAHAGQDVTFNVVVEGNFQSPVGLVQLFDGFSLLGPPLVLSPDFFGFCSCLPTDHSSASLTRSFSQGTHLITLDYTGDGPLGNLPIFGGGLISLVVTGAQSTTALSSSANPSVYGQNVTFSAQVTAPGTTPSGSVQFTLDNANLGSAAPVDPSGLATASTSTLSVGSHAVGAGFSSSDPDVLDSSASLAPTQVVNAADTKTTIASSANPSEYGAAITFTSTTSVEAPGAGSVSGSVQFQDNGANLGSPHAVNGGGQASLTRTDLSVGTHTITAAYTSDSVNFNSSAADTSQTVSKARTSLRYDGAVTSDYHDRATLSSKLTRTDNAAPISGLGVVLTVGSESCTATTDATGEATCAVVPTEASGLYTASAAFAENGNYLGSNDSAPFTLKREETTTTYSGPTVVLGGSGLATLSARLVEDGTNDNDGDPSSLAPNPSGQLITFTLGAQSCSGTTDSTGLASCSISAVSGATLGPKTLSASAAADAYYLGSSDTEPVIVFSFPSKGAFVLGNTSAAAASTATTLSWWSDSWWQLNSLTGGAAPLSFKGFAGDVTALPATSPAKSCGASFTTAPGNSPPPTSGVPSYMGVLVAGTVSKNGSNIAGSWNRIVVVQTNPGYSPTPGHPGTGKIVATFCG